MYHGVLNIYKEAGYTSHDVVAKLRGILHQKKIGHTGTLDPDAVGVLPVCLGRATKLCDLLTDETKTYEAVVRLGVETDTQDMSGQVIRERPVLVAEEEIRSCVKGFLGEQMQIPPMYSALKVNGKKLCELAREGKTVERRPRPVTFYEIEICGIELPRMTMRVTCSKGTYIRTLCHDIGARLGCGGAMEHLIRTRVGRFQIAGALTLSQVESLAGEEKVQEKIISVEEMFSDLPAVTVRPEADLLVHNGNPVAAGLISDGEGGRVRMYDSGGSFIGIYVRKPGREIYRPENMFL